MTARRARRTLGQWGRRGDRVRVLVDASRDRVEVLYTDIDGVDRKRVFSNTKDGRSEALTWGETYHATRERERQRRALGQDAVAPITLRQLWKEYVDSPAWKALREDTRTNYASQWRLWVRFMGDEAIAGDTRIRHVDRFIVRMQEIPVRGGKTRSLNQIRQVLQVVRTVYNWGQSRELVARNDLSLFRWKTPKDAPVNEPDEYTLAECKRIFARLSPQDPKRWRVNVAILLATAAGQRAHAIQHLRWRDVDLEAGVITWPREYQKQGKALPRPILPDMRAALCTAKYWRERMAETLPKRRGLSKATPERLAASDWVLFAEHDRAQPVSYQSIHSMLLKVEREAGVAHREGRAFHGFRRFVVSEIGERMGDVTRGLEYVGDTDVKMLKSYDRRLAKRVAGAAEVLATPDAPDSKSFPNRSPDAENEKAPAEADAVNPLPVGTSDETL